MVFVYIVAGLVVVWLGALTFQRRVWFYRDPVRRPDETGGVIIAPADGLVVYVKKVEDGAIHSEKLGEPIPLPEITGIDAPGREGWAMGIYMSPLDVHFNYCPYPGRVERIHRVSGKLNLPMLDLWEYVRVVWLRRMVDLFARKYHLTNERNTIVLACGGFAMAVVLIADKFVSKIKCFVDEGQDLGYSEKLGFIDRGSQVDLVIFTKEVEVVVRPNQRVVGGKTVIARLLAPVGAGAAAAPHDGVDRRADEP